MKAGKYADQKFTSDQAKARRIWQRTRKQRSEIVEALKSCDFYMTREQMHTRLDRRLDAIDRQQSKAKDLFPDVDESFTIAYMTISV